MAGQHPLQFRGIDHVVLKVTDIERTLHFYTEILGLALERVIEDLQIYQLRCGRNLIDLQVATAGTLLAPRESRGIEHLCLMVQGDFAAVREHLAAHEVPIVWGPLELYGATGFGTSVYIRDPDEHTIELKAEYAEYPLRISLKDAMAGSTRPTGD
jgi:catechol 2,3-dioxygenase-like lactoylglutathione lyase family enzyme